MALGPFTLQTKLEGRFLFGHTLGQGSSGKVVQARALLKFQVGGECPSQEDVVAIKMMKKS
jgi:hypothetical protein